MEFILQAVDFIVHLDKHLGEIIKDFGNWSYLLLFVIVFAETGLVITPFLPGDSLLFVVGTFSALGSFNLLWAFVILVSAAIIGDTVNYAVGKYFGDRIMKGGGGRFFKKEYVAETHLFFEKHGGKTIILARFVPIIRTFAPFVAGLGGMDYRKFVLYNITGALVWVSLFLFGGYYFGNIPLVKNNFFVAVLGMMLVSALPIFFAFAGSLKKPKAG
ncbi:MAG: DedA family protein [Candidatus Omnitrophica bacterium]|nr:DedA family protein [Candidatus Omnitrophota bacterium]